MSSKPEMNFDHALNWCLEHNVEIDPDGNEKGEGHRLRYYKLKADGTLIDEITEGNTLQDAVMAMMDKIGTSPEKGEFVK